MRSLVHFAAVLLLAAPAALAQCTIHVATTGNDGNPGTLAAPLATPNRAIQIAPPGAVVCLRGGTYYPTSDLNITVPLTLQSYPGEAAVLSAPYTESSPVGVMVFAASSNVTIQDIEISGGSWYGIHVNSWMLGVPPANVQIRRVRVHDTGYIGIKGWQSDGILIEDSEVSNTGRRLAGGEGIDIMASLPAAGAPHPHGALVRRNYVHDTGSFGIYMKAGVSNGLIECNRVERTASGGIIVGGSSGEVTMRNGARYECIGCTARNNIVIDTQALGIGCWGAIDSKIHNNTVVNAARAMQAGFHTAVNVYGNGCTNTAVTNNIFVVNSTRPMVHLVHPGPGVTLNNNLYYNSVGAYGFWRDAPTGGNYWDPAGWKAGTGNDAASIFERNPLLDAAATLRPIAGSPAIDMGTLAAAADYAGTARPQGSAPDIGAWEVPVLLQPCCLTAATGSGQTATAGTNFATRLQVKVTDRTGLPVPNVAVTFTAPASGATASFAGQASATVRSDAQGLAVAPVLSAGATSGTFNVLASSPNLASILFSLTVSTAAPAPAPAPAPTPTGTVTLWSGTPPQTGYVSDRPVTLGVKFRSDVAGHIRGIRFWKGSSLDNGTHIGLLYTAAGVLLAQATFTNETASGWQQVNFATPVAIAANTTYIAAYFAPTGSSGNGNNLAYAGADSGPLHVPRHGVQGANGVFAYASTPTFPTLGYGANYWADVVFVRQ